MRAIASPMPDEPPVMIAARSTILCLQAATCEGQAALLANTGAEGAARWSLLSPEAAAATAAVSIKCAYGGADAHEPHGRRRLRGEVLGRSARGAVEGVRAGRGREPSRRPLAGG